MNELEEQANALLQTLVELPFESCASITREFRSLPLAPGLYAVRHREHGLLYLGKAKKLRERFRGGHKACTWAWLDNYDHRDIAISFIPLMMADVLKLGDELEGILIHATKPPYNAQYPSRN
ncbi:GIY-YIG nuclease family protein [Stenomitos frigidus]|uniref:GIY-YIG nuclease family protein n=1 Tax=Stenomitos frigidus TaxID=1886765 RepID=UPI001FEC516D|nr:GIY-YIG nuclease family protein [Stenomitos frigidus]